MKIHFTATFLTIFLIIICAWVPALGKNSNRFTEIRYKNGRTSETFTILEQKNKSSHNLSYQRTGGPKKIKTLSRLSAELIQSESNRIIWTSLYRKPASIKTCTEFATILTTYEKATVCAENQQATAQIYGLINSLRGIL